MLLTPLAGERVRAVMEQLFADTVFTTDASASIILAQAKKTIDTAAAA
jgi:hypothetical protein